MLLVSNNELCCVYS